MWWPWRRPAPEPAGIPPAAHDDAAIARLRQLADEYRCDQGVPVPEQPCDVPWPTSAAEQALTGPTMILSALGPLATPAQQWRGRGGSRR